MSNVLFLGIDGGGTGCRARLTDETGQMIGEGFGGTANVLSAGARSTYASIMTSVAESLQKACLTESDMGRIYAGLGLAGVDRDFEKNKLMRIGFPFAATTIETDGYTACLGAHGGENGAILILGTGSVGYALADGECHTISGCGFMVSDSGSGAAIGLSLLRYSLLAHQGLKCASTLTKEVMTQFDNDPQEMCAWTRSAQPRDYGSFMPLFFERVNDGDPVAKYLLEAALKDVQALIEKLWSFGVPRLCLLGGISQAIMPFLPQRTQDLLSEPLADALDGALLLAHQNI